MTWGEYESGLEVGLPICTAGYGVGRIITRSHRPDRATVPSTIERIGTATGLTWLVEHQ